MKIVSWNVNGLRSALSKNLAGFLAEAKPDVFCVQETRVGAETAETLDIPFKYRYYHSAEKPGYSGVAIFSNVEPLDVEGIPLCGSPDEGRLITADFGNFKLSSIYAPNAQDGLKRIAYKRAWNAALIRRISSGGKNILCGDFNVAHNDIDIARPAENAGNAGFSEGERFDFSDILKKLDLSDIWRERNPGKIQYTWWSYRGGARRRNVGWRIDYFLVSRSIVSEIGDVSILDGVAGSDHAPLTLVVNRD